MNNYQSSVWHEGELAIQKLAGTDVKMAEIGPKYIRDYMPQQHRDFFESLQMIFIGYTDYSSNIYSTILFGQPGFINSPTAQKLIINIQQTMGDIFTGDLSIGDLIGCVGIEFDTKRRNRVNGIITDITQKTIELSILQSYGNCPKYIQQKLFTQNPDYGNFSVTRYQTLSNEDKQLIRQADVFFIASSYNDNQQLSNRGVDNSHRGGEPGFVTINNEGQLLIDDYYGNGFYNTLGNLHKNPIGNLLFCDWQKGHALQITVEAKLIWPSSEAEDTQRVVSFSPKAVVKIQNGLGFLQKPDD